MSNNELLTEEEFIQFRPHPLLLAQIESCRNQFQLDKNVFRILDWGCGRGKFVLWLREKGYDAFGVEVDANPFQNGADLFTQKGYEIGKHLFQVDQNGHTPFENSSFHFVTSYQVLEHVCQLDPVIAEIQRVTQEGGEGFHMFPPHRRLIEGHLFMPLVHWLPKNRLRKYLILLFVCLGIEPHWWRKGKMPLQRKVDVYYNFSIHHTFYRTHDAIRTSFSRRGFNAEIVDVCDYGRGRRFAYRYLLQKPSSRLVQVWYRNFGGDLGLATALHLK